MDVAQKFNNRRARSHKQVPKGMGNNIMKAIVDNHLVEIIEETANGLWLVLDTETGRFLEVPAESLFEIEY